MKILWHWRKQLKKKWKMEKPPMLIDQKSWYCNNGHPMKSKLWIQCNPNKIPGLFSMDIEKLNLWTKDKNNTAVSHMNSQQLWLHGWDLHKINPVKTVSWKGKHMGSQCLIPSWRVDGYWGRVIFPLEVAIGRLPMYQWIISHPCAYC